MPILAGFIENAALLLLLTLVFDLRTRWSTELHRHGRGGSLGLGLLLGAAGIATMLVPVRLEPHIIIDARGLLLAIAGLFFGLVPTTVAMAVTALYRVLAIGGPSSLTGVVFIVGSGALGLGLRHLHRRQGGRQPHWVELALLGLVVAAFQLALTARLLPASDTSTLDGLPPALCLVSGGATLLMGLLLKGRTRSAVQLAALNAAVDAIAVTDADGRYLWVNPAFEALTQYRSAEVIGKNPRELIRSGKHTPEFYRQLWDTLMDGRVWTGELINRRKDGSEYTEEQTITPVKDAEGRVTHFITIKRDITHRRLLEQQLNQSQRIEGIGRLAGGVAHDFNNLLTVINGTVEMAATRARGDAAMTKDLQTVRDAAARGAKLTRQLLAFSRQQVLQPTIVDLNAVVSEMHEMLSRVIGERITMRLELEADLAHIRADSGQLGQVVMNLVVNARDAMPDGGQIVLRSGTRDYAHGAPVPIYEMPPGRYVTLSVADTGIGMDAATLERIFEPFYTTKAPGKGTGLGLPTAYGIVKQSGGFIWVESARGKGTCFHLAFPAVDEAVSERPSGPTARIELPEDAQLAHATILLVEDEDAIRHVATRVLSSRGYTVLPAASGEEALAIAEREAVDLLLTDMVMPGMNGPELAEAVKRLRPSVKVLFTSGYSREAVSAGIGDAGFIAKPYGLRELVGAVSSRLEM